jgi:hypothetical protein
MKKFILFLILLSASSLYSQWQLATNEPYDNAYSAIDKDGYVYVITNNKDFFRYSPVDSAWNLLSSGVEPEALYVNDDNELIRGMKEISADKGETWNPISFTDHENAGLSILFSKNVFLISYYDYDKEARTRVISTDGGHTWEPFLNEGYTDYYLCDKGLLTSQQDSAGFKKYYFFSEPNSPENIELSDPAGMGHGNINQIFGSDSVGRILIYDESVCGRIFRLDDSILTVVCTTPPSNPYCINKDIFRSGSLIYQFRYNENGWGGFWEIFQYPPWPDDGRFISEASNGGIYNITYADNSYNVDLKTGTWKSLNKGIPSGTITAMANDYEGNIYAGTQAKGVYKSLNGLDFHLIHNNGRNPVEALFSADTLLYALYSIYEGSSSELRWVNYPEIYELGVTAHIGNYAANKGNLLFCYDINGEYDKYVQYSRDGISRYNLFTIPDSLNVTALFTDSSNFAIAYNNNNVLITDETLKENGESTVTPSALTTIVADQEGSLLGGSSNGLYKLENPVPSGKLLKTSVVKEWTPAGLDGHKINTLYNDVTDSAFVIYAGTDDGVYYSTNNGASWEAYNTVSSKLAKMSEAANKVTGFSVQGGNVFANINNTLYKAPRVAYKGIATEDEPNIVPASFELKQNYPNPFNPVTNISFTLPKAAKVKLTVYDMLGREVETLVNMELGQGSYSYRFDGHNLSSGVYIYSLEAGSVRTAKKMALIK